MDNELFPQQALGAQKHAIVKPRTHSKRLRAIDLWERDEHELQRQAKRFASGETFAGGVEFLSEVVESAASSQHPHSLGSGGDDLRRSDLVEVLGLSCTRSVEVDIRSYAARHVAPDYPTRQSHPDPKGSRDCYPHSSNITTATEIEPQKRRRNNASCVESSEVDKYLPTPSTRQDAFISEILQKLDDEKSKTRAIKDELERLEQNSGTTEETPKGPKRRYRGKNAVRKRRKADQADQSYQTALLADSSSLRNGYDGTGHLATFTRFGELPDNVQDMIFGILLQSHDPIRLSTAKLKAFVKDSIDVPPATLIPTKGIRRKHQLKPPRVLRLELEQMRADLHKLPQNQQPSKSVVSDLTLSLLYVSKQVYQRAARSFYSTNIFEFTNTRDAWLHLESFLIAIGPRNVGSLQHLSVAVPKWYPDASSDRIAGALLDALSPITRLAKSTGAAEDPLLSAISSCASMLAAQGGVKSFRMAMSFDQSRPYLDQKPYAPGYALSPNDQVTHVKRGRDGVRVLRALSRALSPGCKPELVVHTSTFVVKRKTEFDRLLPSIELEAEKYGWAVHRFLTKSSKRKELEDM